MIKNHVHVYNNYNDELVATKQVKIKINVETFSYVLGVPRQPGPRLAPILFESISMRVSILRLYVQQPYTHKGRMQ